MKRRSRLATASRWTSTSWDVAARSRFDVVDCLGDLRVSLSFNSDINLIEKGAVGYTTLVGHQGPANTCSYSRDMGSVFTGGSDGRVIEWTQGRGRLVTVALGRRDDV